MPMRPFPDPWTTPYDPRDHTGKLEALRAFLGRAPSAPHVSAVPVRGVVGGPPSDAVPLPPPPVALPPATRPQRVPRPGGFYPQVPVGDPSMVRQSRPTFWDVIQWVQHLQSPPRY